MLLMRPASAVSSAAPAGANIAPNGIWVGSVPVSNTGSVMARMVAPAHSTSATTDSPIIDLVSDDEHYLTWGDYDPPRKTQVGAAEEVTLWDD